MGKKILLAFWDCSNCGKTRIAGFRKKCPRCKDPQNSVLTPSEDWYLPDNAPEVTDPEQLKHFEAGPAWNCGHCGTLNDGDVDVCQYEGCGRPRDFDDTVNRTVTYDDRADHFDELPDKVDEMIEDKLERAERALETHATGPLKLNDITRPAGEIPRIGEHTLENEAIRDKAYADFDARMEKLKMSQFMRYFQPHLSKIAVAIGVIAVLCIVFGAVSCIRSYTETVAGTVTITKLTWQRSVEVEEFKTLTQGNWDYPGDARVQGSENRVRDHRKVHDGWHDESYTDYESRPRVETYTDYESRPRTEYYNGTCSRMVNNGNGSYTSETYSCPQSRTVYDTVPVVKTRTVYDQVPVQKTRSVEDYHMEPIWDTWYTYQIDRWVTDRWVDTSGTQSGGVRWAQTGDMKLSTNDQAGDQVGEEKVGDERRESYAVVYIDSTGESHTDRHGDMKLWDKLFEGEKINAQYRKKSGKLVSVDWSSADMPEAVPVG